MIKRIAPLCISFPLCAIGAQQCHSLITIYTNYQTSTFNDLVCSHTVKLNRHQHANKRYFVQLYMMSCGLSLEEAETLLLKGMSKSGSSPDLKQFMYGEGCGDDSLSPGMRSLNQSCNSGNSACPDPSAYAPIQECSREAQGDCKTRSEPQMRIHEAQATHPRHPRAHPIH